MKTSLFTCTVLFCIASACPLCASEPSAVFEIDGYSAAARDISEFSIACGNPVLGLPFLSLPSRFGAPGMIGADAGAQLRIFIFGDDLFNFMRISSVPLADNGTNYILYLDSIAKAERTVSGLRIFQYAPHRRVAVKTTEKAAYASPDSGAFVSDAWNWIEENADNLQSGFTNGTIRLVSTVSNIAGFLAPLVPERNPADSSGVAELAGCFINGEYRPVLNQFGKMSIGVYGDTNAVLISLIAEVLPGTDAEEALMKCRTGNAVDRGANDSSAEPGETLLKTGSDGTSPISLIPEKLRAEMQCLTNSPAFSWCVPESEGIDFKIGTGTGSNILLAAELKISAETAGKMLKTWDETLMKRNATTGIPSDNNRNINEF